MILQFLPNLIVLLYLLESMLTIYFNYLDLSTFTAFVGGLADKLFLFDFSGTVTWFNFGDLIDLLAFYFLFLAIDA